MNGDRSHTRAEEENVAYLYDGTLEGLLSAIFLSYELHERPLDVVRLCNYEPRLGQDARVVDTNFERAARVRSGVERKAGRSAFLAIMRASTCDDYDMGSIIYRFVRYVMERPDELRRIPVLSELATPEVSDVQRLAKRAVNESENMRQFVRFSHLENGVWFARVNPNASVVPLVMGHFSARFNDQAFIIYDETHQLAGVYDGRRWQLVASEALNIPPATDHDRLVKNAWQRFYDTLNIDARRNPELRRHFMPVRLWRNLPEMHPRTFADAPENSLANN